MAETVALRSDGVPLFAEELTRFVVERGTGHDGGASQERIGGARPADILVLIMRQGFSMALIGIAIGLGGAAWMSGLLKTQLYAVSPLDPAVYGAVAVLLGGIALAACVIPARRAATRPTCSGTPCRIPPTPPLKSRRRELHRATAKALIEDSWISRRPSRS
jgi:hypothetical protein